MATHSTVFAWRIPWTEEPSGLQSRGSQESDTTEHMRTTKNSFVCGRIFQTPFLIIYSLLPEYYVHTSVVNSLRSLTLGSYFYFYC